MGRRLRGAIQLGVGKDGRRALVANQEVRPTVATAYTNTHVDYLRVGIGVPHASQPEDSPWYILHTAAEALRAEWHNAAARLDAVSLPAALIGHAKAGLAEAEEPLRLIEALGIVASGDTRVLAQARDTLEGLTSATGRLIGKGDLYLLASWAAGQGVQLWARLATWLPLLPSRAVQPNAVTVVYDASTEHAFTGGWVA